MKIIKNLVFKSLVLALPFLFVGNINASVANTLKIETDASEKSIYLSFEANNSSIVLIQIKDNNEVILHQEKITNQKAFSKKFNLKNLPKGEYFLEISDEIKDVIQPIEVSDSNVEIDPLNRSEHYKPVYVFNHNMLAVNFLALKNDKLTVQISNSQNREIFTQEFETGGLPFGKRFDMSKLEKGKYTVKVIAKEGVYYKTITVQ